MSETQMEEYRRLRARCHVASRDLIEALNKRDTVDGELTRSRHPLAAPRVEYLTAQSIHWHRICEYHEKELDTYAMRLKRLAHELELDEFEEKESARPVKQRAPQQASLFA